MQRFRVRLTCCQKVAARFTSEQMRALIDGKPPIPLTCPKCCAQVGVNPGVTWYSDDYANLTDGLGADISPAHELERQILRNKREPGKPEYCVQETVESCRECSLVNYGLDCMNERVLSDVDGPKCPRNV